MSGDSSEEKKHKASDTKLRKEREKGRIPKSADLYAISGTLAAVITIFFLSSFIIERIQSIFDAATRATSYEWTYGYQHLMSTLAFEYAMIILPIFGIVVSTVFVANMIYNKGIPFSLDPIKPQFNRLNPAQGFKNIFGTKGMVNGGQMLVRLTLWLGGAVTIVWLFVSDIINLPLCGEFCINDIGESMATQLIAYACIILLIVAMFDMPIQKALFMKDQKMGDSERKREDKDNFGSPEIKAARRELQQELLAAPTLPVGLKNATILIVGKRCAAAVFYNPHGDYAPSIVATAIDGKVYQFIEMSKEQNTPIFKDVELATALSKVPAGTLVPADHFKPLAQAMVDSGVGFE